MKRWITLVAMVYVVTWKAVGAGEEVCDLNEYTNAKVFCQRADVEKNKTFNTEEGAKTFMDKAPSKGVKDMKMDEREPIGVLHAVGLNGVTW